MRTFYPTINPNHPATAAAALHLAHGNVYAALGAICLLAWFILHRFAAHRHPVVEWLSWACLAASGLIFAATLGVVGKWCANVNNLTANWLSKWTGDPTFANDHLGLLTVLAFVDVAFAITVTADLIAHLRRNGVGANGRPKRHPRWGAMEESFNKWGWFGLGPLAATMPGTAGVWVVTWLTLLSETISHFLGSLVGLG
ncbi:hypothetical protein Caci_2873 [Catenulispora acidiphila DSM 44928]|uniref:Uncharacterized protein n=1 Tax=Catenulispora acidiphila (strain DSM 44928 / JCM 14897 / NBRC 102108 / NRRL B-24433 / ID139908) TaxID=479433 RepID=C7Q1A7_CATAD|nr:hypothetical protein [Catenulispora acidiphila]ACU71782.1 hypothetical protein Caci_2873 [Catenulispora acidiphila DSM 44928]